MAPDLIGITGMSISVVTPGFINQIGPAEIGLYPNYLLVYVHHLLTGQVTIAITMTVYFYLKPALWSHYKRQCKDLLETIFK